MAPNAGETDGALLQRFQRGERECFQPFYRRHCDRLYAYLHSLTGDPGQADDLLQRVFLKVLRKTDAFAGADAPKAYLYQTARNLFLNTRSGARQSVSTESLFALTDAAPDPATLAAMEEERVLVGRAVMALPQDQRECVMLYIYGDFTFDQVAEITGQPRSSVMYRYNAGLKNLRKTLSD